MFLNDEGFGRVVPPKFCWALAALGSMMATFSSGRLFASTEPLVRRIGGAYHVLSLQSNRLFVLASHRLAGEKVDVVDATI